MKTIKDFKKLVGQKIWCLVPDSRRNQPAMPMELTIVKVGVKYITFEGEGFHTGSDTKKFHIKDGSITKLSNGWKTITPFESHATLDRYVADTELVKIVRDKMRDMVTIGGDVTIDQARRIAHALELELPDGCEPYVSPTEQVLRKHIFFTAYTDGCEFGMTHEDGQKHAKQVVDNIVNLSQDDFDIIEE